MNETLGERACIIRAKMGAAGKVSVFYRGMDLWQKS